MGRREPHGVASFLSSLRNKDLEFQTRKNTVIRYALKSAERPCPCVICLPGLLFFTVLIEDSNDGPPTHF